MPEATKPRDSLYPTEWRWATHAGCGPKCKQRQRRIEVRDLGPNRKHHRHVYTVSELLDALNKAGHTVRRGRVGGGSTIYALTPAGTTPDLKHPELGRVTAVGSSDRQALQNLADKLHAKYGERCPR